MWSVINSRLLAAERKIEQILAAIAAIIIRLGNDEQAIAALQGYQGSSGGSSSSGLIRANLNASLTGTGTPASPQGVAGTILVPNGSGGWTATGGLSTTIYDDSGATITVSGSLFCWVWKDPADGLYYLVSAAC